MKTVIALIIKLILMFAATWVSFSIFGDVNMTFVWIIAIASTVLNYLIGDLLILPRFGNWIAAICDGILAAITAYAVLAAYTYYTTVSLTVFAILVAVFELFFHMYLINANIIKRKNSDSNSMKHKKLNYSTETAREMHPSYSKNSAGSNAAGTSGTGSYFSGTSTTSSTDRSSQVYNHSSNISDSSTNKDDVNRD